MSRKKYKKSKVFTYWIDIAGSCNLNCPSCPSGNFTDGDFSGGKNAVGFMDFDLYEDILDKIQKDGVSDNPQIHLYNWGEPLLHPQAPKFIAAARQRGLYCGVSSNLNLEKNLKEAVKAGPNYFRVSASGYYQDSYGRTHRGGNALMVKSNLYKLRYYMDTLKKDFYCEVSYHIYRRSPAKEAEMMLALCNELKFNFSPVWAYFMPLEKNLAYLRGNLPLEDKKTIDLLAISPDQAIKASIPFNGNNCTVQERTMAVNFDGSVQLCCNTFDHAYAIAKSFLDARHDELQEAKYAHHMCDTCMDKALHVVLAYGAGSTLDDMGNAALKSAGSELTIHQFSEPKISTQRAGPIKIEGLRENQMAPKKARGLRRLLNKVRGK